jgi:hypothetical protein
MTDRTEAQIAAERAREERWVTVKIRLLPEEVKALDRIAGNRPRAGFIRTLVRKRIERG